MPFKPTFVSPGEDPGAAPWLGFPRTEIVMEQPNGEGAATPTGIEYEDRARTSENVIGGDVRFNRRKVVSVSFDIDFIDAAKKAELERLYFDNRDVYLCPNYGVDTRLSIPFQRSENCITGRPGSYTRTGREYIWDEEDQIMRAWDANDIPLGFHGHWSRYFKTTNGWDNRLAVPHPALAGVGWTVAAGTCTLAYNGEYLSPVMRQRTVTNAEGIMTVDASGGGGTVQIEHATGATLNTTNNVTGNVLIRCQGLITIDLMDVGTATIYDSTTFIGNGRWELIKLDGANSNATNDAKLRITFLGTTSTRSQTAFIASSYISNDQGSLGGEVPVPDWADAGGLAVGTMTNGDTIDFFNAHWTISFFTKFDEARTGYFTIGSGGASISMRKSGTQQFEIYYPDGAGGTIGAQVNNIDTLFGLSDGDWFHVAAINNGNHIRVYINGVTIGLTITNPESELIDDWFRIGNVFGGNYMENSGISHWRVDNAAWTTDQLQDHYDTYFESAGRGVIEPAFGRLGYISELNFDGARVGSGQDQWVGSVTWTELETDADFAPIQKQEGDV